MGWKTLIIVVLCITPSLAEDVNELEHDPNVHVRVVPIKGKRKGEDFADIFSDAIMRCNEFNFEEVNGFHEILEDLMKSYGSLSELDQRPDSVQKSAAESFVDAVANMVDDTEAEQFQRMTICILNGFRDAFTKTIGKNDNIFIEEVSRLMNILQEKIRDGSIHIPAEDSNEPEGEIIIISKDDKDGQRQNANQRNLHEEIPWKNNGLSTNENPARIPAGDANIPTSDVSPRIDDDDERNRGLSPEGRIPLNFPLHRNFRNRPMGFAPRPRIDKSRDISDPSPDEPENRPSPSLETQSRFPRRENVFPNDIENRNENDFPDNPSDSENLPEQSPDDLRPTFSQNEPRLKLPRRNPHNWRQIYRNHPRYGPGQDYENRKPFLRTLFLHRRYFSYFPQSHRVLDNGPTEFENPDENQPEGIEPSASQNNDAHEPPQQYPRDNIHHLHNWHRHPWYKPVQDNGPTDIENPDENQPEGIEPAAPQNIDAFEPLQQYPGDSIPHLHYWHRHPWHKPVQDNGNGIPHFRIPMRRFRPSSPAESENTDELPSEDIPVSAPQNEDAIESPRPYSHHMHKLYRHQPWNAHDPSNGEPKSPFRIPLRYRHRLRHHFRNNPDQNFKNPMRHMSFSPSDDVNQNERPSNDLQSSFPENDGPVELPPQDSSRLNIRHHPRYDPDQDNNEGRPAFRFPPHHHRYNPDLNNENGKPSFRIPLRHHRFRIPLRHHSFEIPLSRTRTSYPNDLENPDGQPDEGPQPDSPENNDDAIEPPRRYSHHLPWHRHHPKYDPDKPSFSIPFQQHRHLRYYPDLNKNNERPFFGIPTLHHRFRIPLKHHSLEIPSDPENQDTPTPTDVENLGERPYDGNDSSPNDDVKTPRQYNHHLHYRHRHHPKFDPNRDYDERGPSSRVPFRHQYHRFRYNPKEHSYPVSNPHYGIPFRPHMFGKILRGRPVPLSSPDNVNEIERPSTDLQSSAPQNDDTGEPSAQQNDDPGEPSAQQNADTGEPSAQQNDDINDPQQKYSHHLPYMYRHHPRYDSDPDYRQPKPIFRIPLRQDRHIRYYPKTEPAQGDENSKPFFRIPLRHHLFRIPRRRFPPNEDIQPSAPQNEDNIEPSKQSSYHFPRYESAPNSDDTKPIARFPFHRQNHQLRYDPRNDPEQGFRHPKQLYRIPFRHHKFGHMFRRRSFPSDSPDELNNNKRPSNDLRSSSPQNEVPFNQPNYDPELNFGKRPFVRIPFRHHHHLSFYPEQGNTNGRPRFRIPKRHHHFGIPLSPLHLSRPADFSNPDERPYPEIQPDYPQNLDTFGPLRPHHWYRPHPKYDPNQDYGQPVPSVRIPFRHRYHHHYWHHRPHHWHRHHPKYDPNQDYGQPVPSVRIPFRHHHHHFHYYPKKDPFPSLNPYYGIPFRPHIFGPISRGSPVPLSSPDDVNWIERPPNDLRSSAPQNDASFDSPRHDPDLGFNRQNPAFRIPFRHHRHPRFYPGQGNTNGRPLFRIPIRHHRFGIPLRPLHLSSPADFSNPDESPYPEIQPDYPQNLDNFGPLLPHHWYRHHTKYDPNQDYGQPVPSVTIPSRHHNHYWDHRPHYWHRHQPKYNPNQDYGQPVPPVRIPFRHHHHHFHYYPKRDPYPSSNPYYGIPFRPHIFGPISRDSPVPLSSPDDINRIERPPNDLRSSAPQNDAPFDSPGHDPDLGFNRQNPTFRIPFRRHLRIPYSPDQVKGDGKPFFRIPLRNYHFGLPFRHHRFGIPTPPHYWHRHHPKYDPNQDYGQPVPSARMPFRNHHHRFNYYPKEYQFQSSDPASGIPFRPQIFGPILRGSPVPPFRRYHWGIPLRPIHLFDPTNFENPDEQVIQPGLPQNEGYRNPRLYYKFPFQHHHRHLRNYPVKDPDQDYGNTMPFRFPFRHHHLGPILRDRIPLIPPFAVNPIERPSNDLQSSSPQNENPSERPHQHIRPDSSQHDDTSEPPPQHPHHLRHMFRHHPRFDPDESSREPKPSFRIPFRNHHRLHYNPSYGSNQGYGHPNQRIPFQHHGFGPIPIFNGEPPFPNNDLNPNIRKPFGNPENNLPASKPGDFDDGRDCGDDIIEKARSVIPSLSSDSAKQNILALISSLESGFNTRTGAVDFSEFFDKLSSILHSSSSDSQTSDLQFLSAIFEALIAALETLNGGEIMKFYSVPLSHDIRVYSSYLSDVLQ